MKKCAFVTLGCKVNQYETQAIREIILGKGYVETTPDKKADLYVINTCTITAVSDIKSKQCIRKIRKKSPDAKIIVTGCYADAYNDEPDNIKDPNIIIIGQDKKGDIGRILSDDGLADVNVEVSSIFNLNISRFDGHTRAFLKIEDGCDNSCSYCIVPSVRGSVKSRPINDVKVEAERLVSNGHTEIVLTGIHLGAYGKDLNKDGTNGKGKSISLINVLEQLEKISGLKRIRISSIEAYEITDELISMIIGSGLAGSSQTGSGKICPHLHLPLQSGDDYILKRMNRKYTVDKFLALLDRVRSTIDNPSFSTDVIVGFPGEESEHFENTITTCQKAGFSRIHIFPYSVRKGTSAARMENHCDPGTIMERRKIMGSVANELADKYKQNFINKNIEVLVESKFGKEDGMLCGYTERYVKVVFDSNEEKINNIVTVRAKEISGDHISGELV
ncbi:MAG: tRNA (N(6)-L-threonylcarbamoyladenosine(37)-C(2))-methylthiotransferase MtaB [Candidatus Anammoxibacter sp.]